MRGAQTVTVLWTRTVDLIDQDDAAERLGVDVETLLLWARQGRGPTGRWFHGRRCYGPWDVDNWLAAHGSQVAA